MEVKKKQLIGISILIAGIVLLVIGILEYGNTSGLNGALIALAHPHLYVILRVFAYLALGWGLALLISGILVLFFAFTNHIFKGKKIIALVISLLVVGFAITGIFAVAAAPPATHVSVSYTISSHDGEVGQSSSNWLAYNLTSNYHGYYYLNSTVNGNSRELCNGTLSTFQNYTLVKYDATNFQTPGKHTITLTLISNGVKKTSTTTIYVYPALSVSFTGPTNINDASGSASAVYSSTYSGASITNYTWSVSCESFSNVQNASYNLYSPNLNVQFFLNDIPPSDAYGYNVTYFISLTVSDSYGETATYPTGFNIFEVNVTGN